MYYLLQMWWQYEALMLNKVNLTNVESVLVKIMHRDVLLNDVLIYVSC